MEGKMVLTL